MMELIPWETSDYAPALTSLAVLVSFKEENKGSSPRRRLSLWLRFDADAFLNLLHGSNPVCSELKRNFSQRTEKNDSFFPLHLYCSLVSNIHVIVSMICVLVFGDLIHCTAMFQ